jgi:hypothetical protein
MFRYSISFIAVIFMIALFIAYWIMHVEVHAPNSTVGFVPLLTILILGIIAGATLAVIFIRYREELKEEKK